MNQALITNFTVQTSSIARKDPGKRTYQQVVDDIKDRAEVLFKKKQDKEKDLLVKKEDLSSTKPKMSYKRYTLEQKEVIMELVHHLSYAQIEEKYGVDESTVRKWVKTGCKEDGRKKNGRKPVLEELEKELKELLLKKREQGQPIQGNVIISELKKLYVQKYDVSEKEFLFLQNWAKYCAKEDVKIESIVFLKSNDSCYTFNDEGNKVLLSNTEMQLLRDAVLKVNQKVIIFDSNWIHRFIERNGFSYRKVSSVNFKPKDELERDVKEFLKEIKTLREQYNIPNELIINFDETGIFFDQIPTYTYEKIGIKHPSIKASSFVKKRMTAGLGITAIGEKFYPILVFKGQGLKFRNLSNNCGYVIKKNKTTYDKRYIQKLSKNNSEKVFD